MSNIYYTLSKIPVIKNNYSLKFLFVAFIGIHIPLISLIILLINSPSTEISKSLIFIIALVFTLIATTITLYILNGLLKPLNISKNALNNYLNNSHLPQLPTIYKDEVGVLMHSLQKTITFLDAHIKETRNYNFSFAQFKNSA
ncbi:hypothetical protein [Pedobacter alpinus]|uniref:HAMP domain-containing protein n=1 Tax=Pedobacter alpinus TaxID=1590643 RepID=A0ABW5TTM2_9SPHI